MKKSSRSQVSKSAFNLAKSLTNTQEPDPESFHLTRHNSMEDSKEMQRLEEEVMGEVSETDSLKSVALQRNLDQMIDVLHLRLRALETAARVRLDFCAEDLMANSKKESKMAPKIMEEFEDQHVNPRILMKDVKVTNQSKDVNLVSMEGVYMDPSRLVIRTKMATESAKKLETKLEDKYSSSRMELKGKKSLKGARVARNKETQSKRYEDKKRLEKKLTANMDNYLTRPINDADLNFQVPEDFNDEVQFPISIKWPAREHRGGNLEGSEGEMDPELLLNYSLERISLPSGDTLFHRFFKNMCVQQYFVYMFWFIKVLFFKCEEEDESVQKFLLRKLGVEYVKIVDTLSKTSHGENKKDFVFRFFPYILTNAVYYAFFFLCPGSRHLYSKGLRKTILVQIVQVMHGVQLCPVSVRVSWAKLFPDEVQDEEDGEDADMIPMTVPVQHLKKATGPEEGSNYSSRPRSKSAGKAPGGRGGKIIHDNSDDLDDDSDMRSEGSQLSGRPGSHDSLPSIRLGQSTPPDPDSTHNFKTMVNPLARVELRPAPSKHNFLVPRQKRERNDISFISPQIQEYLNSSTATGGQPSQTLSRTVPVSWCTTGGSDTHRRRHIPKDLHDDLSNRSKSMQKNLRRNNSKTHNQRVRDSRKIDKNCTAVLTGGAAVVASFSQDLVRKLKHAHSLAELESTDEKALQSSVQSLHGGEEEEFSAELINSVLGVI
jgi:hypothetical protein